ncbi:P-loop containing nucleoside triphosphate hydrolase protein [Mycena albidolilacea]|uniref:P-loop containing nucleoside triphosphate hydrolase protein n=1 Tax=Mycena albidolilacea TaxID=1033008 RepID=A0AAD6ZIH7_9AGAR|nr:P-loop containing nucleoside triphosphate hydrolase protein [Mycena albidolilacea]
MTIWRSLVVLGDNLSMLCFHGGRLSPPWDLRWIENIMVGYITPMLSKSSNTVDRILQYTAVAADALQDVASTAHIPFLDTVCTLVLTIVPIVQAIKSQKDRCLSMMENVHRLLSALMSLCVHSDEVRSPKILDQIAECVITLEKFHSCLRAQQEIGTIKRLFKQNEITAQLDTCEAELKAALQVFSIDYGLGMAMNMVDFSIDTERRHQELLELISFQSDTASSIERSSLNASSGSLSLLPPSPKIFHGRDSELKQLIEVLLCEPARAAILGPGGMGKTTLAMAALHHPAVTEKYGLRHFISCESADTLGDLVTTIGLHLGLEPSAMSSKTILRHFAQCGTCLVVLDNLETPWEPLDSRAQVEEFLSLLADNPSFGLLLTMRGAERPGKVKWNRPFLPPLEPLPLAASRQIFVEVADEPGSGEESILDHLLDLTESLPLAVSLMANIASFEGYSTTLARWQTENTALLSEGHDKRSNLEKSIALSISGPRISSAPYAKNLSSLLSLLPDGIRPDDLIAGNVPIPNVRQCQSVLVGISLAYIDVNGRLKMLSPVREYIRRVHPPSHSLSRPLRKHFQDLLELLSSKHQLSYSGLAPELVGNLGNINQLILEGLMTEKKPAWIGIGESIITLDFFSALMLKGGSPLFQRLPQLIEATGDAALQWKYAGRILGNGRYHLIEDPEGLIRDGIQYCNAGTQPARQGAIISGLL